MIKNDIEIRGIDLFSEKIDFVNRNLFCDLLLEKIKIYAFTFKEKTISVFEYFWRSTQKRFAIDR